MPVSAFFAALATFLLALPSFAQQPQPVRIRGMIEAVDGPSLTIKSRNGEAVKVRLADNARISALVKASAADLKPNTYIGVTSVPASDGSEKAVAVHIFPEERRGTAEGRVNWDLLPDSKMTNGALNLLQVEGVHGGTMTVSYKGQEAKIALTPETKIVAYTGGDKGELKPGTQIIIFGATRGDDGVLQATAISYGRDGLVPPM
ncbi:MAG: hypothetical protein JOZ84_06730 [Methylobacteriaceae bacterium]|nr:hypothetical protein [Methylobacteriaceae bacterium]MBV9394089.1 hypothetical protein [Methylobacteriaceae bacterium]